jgi:hypothetical protein
MAVLLGGIGATRKPKVKSIEVWGKRWFQKSYGNTYHAVRVYVNDELIGASKIAYGYGDSYLQTAEEVLKKAGYLKLKNQSQSLSSYCREKKINLKYYANDVSKESELKTFINI